MPSPVRDHEKVQDILVQLPFQAKVLHASKGKGRPWWSILRETLANKAAESKSDLPRSVERLMHNQGTSRIWSDLLPWTTLHNRFTTPSIEGDDWTGWTRVSRVLSDPRVALIEREGLKGDTWPFPEHPSTRYGQRMATTAKARACVRVCASSASKGRARKDLHQALSRVKVLRGTDGAPVTPTELWKADERAVLAFGRSMG